MGISLYPNPANSTFSLRDWKVKENVQQNVTLSDLTGKVIKSFKQPTSSEFDISDVSNGLYIVNVWEEGHKTFNSKISVVR